MKKILMLIIVHCLFVKFSFINAQQKVTTVKKVYAEGGVGASTGNGIFGQLGVRAVFKNNWTIAISSHSVTQDAKNTPSDYDPGYTSIFFIPIEGTKPTIDMNFLSLTSGKIFPLGRKTWFTTEAGISLVNGEKVNFTRAIPSQSGDDLFSALFGITGSSSNYTTHKEKETTIGGMLKADFTWAFSSFAGLGAGVFANFNSIQSAAGFEIKLTMGWMNNPKKQKAK